MQNFGNKLLFWANRQLTVVKKKCSMQGFCDLLCCGRENNNNGGRHCSFQTNSDMSKYFLRGSRGFSTTYRGYDNRYVKFPLISIPGGKCKMVFGDCYLWRWLKEKASLVVSVGIDIVRLKVKAWRLVLFVIASGHIHAAPETST